MVVVGGVGNFGAAMGYIDVSRPSGSSEGTASYVSTRVLPVAIMPARPPGHRDTFSSVPLHALQPPPAAARVLWRVLRRETSGDKQHRRLQHYYSLDSAAGPKSASRDPSAH